MSHKESSWKPADSDGCTFWPDGNLKMGDLLVRQNAPELTFGEVNRLVFG